MIEKKYAFDLDGTVTTVETLPLLANELGLSTEIKFLTERTLEGAIPFDVSFRLRYSMLKKIPSRRIAEIMSTVPLDVEIEKFIVAHRSECVIVTGNLFGDIASEWLNVRMSGKTEKHLKNLGFRLNKYILPKLAGRPIKDIKTPEILYICREIEKRVFYRLQHASRISSGRFLDLRLPQGTVSMIRPSRLPEL